MLPTGNLSARVSAESVRGQGLAFLSELYDVTADGSAVWTRVGSSTKTTTYTPATGSSLVNNSTTNVATFGGGSYSMIRYPGSRWQQRFDNLKVAVNGASPPATAFDGDRLCGFADDDAAMDACRDVEVFDQR